LRHYNAATEVVRLITEVYPDCDVYIGIDSLGKEPLLAAVAAATGAPVRVSQERAAAAAAALAAAEDVVAEAAAAASEDEAWEDHLAAGYGAGGIPDLAAAAAAAGAAGAGAGALAQAAGVGAGPGAAAGAAAGAGAGAESEGRALPPCMFKLSGAGAGAENTAVTSAAAAYLGVAPSGVLTSTQCPSRVFAIPKQQVTRARLADIAKDSPRGVVGRVLHSSTFRLHLSCFVNESTQRIPRSVLTFR